MFTMEQLKAESHLPGPRGNLELLYRFIREATLPLVEECLRVIKPNTANSPEEFVGMCGVLGYAVLHAADKPKTLGFLRPYAGHGSWRIREAVAMGIQELSAGSLETTLPVLGSWALGSPLEQRAVVAGLCDPKVLQAGNTGDILSLLARMTRGLDHDRRLTDSESSLRQALGYGWSVAVVASPAPGKAALEALLTLGTKHPSWIVRENLRKNRLVKMDPAWVETCEKRMVKA